MIMKSNFVFIICIFIVALSNIFFALRVYLIVVYDRKYNTNKQCLVATNLENTKHIYYCYNNTLYNLSLVRKPKKKQQQQ